MADEEPFNQIVTFYSDGDNHHYPSRPPNASPMASQDGGIGHSKSPTSNGNPESQFDGRQNDSCASLVQDTQFESTEDDTQLHDSTISCVEDTQFVQVENDTQAVDDAKFPSTQQDSQFQNTDYEHAQFVRRSIAAPLLSRPNIGNIDDIAKGFTFSTFQKPVKGMFNRPAPNTSNSQRSSEEPSNEDPPMSLPCRLQHIAEGPVDGVPAGSAMESPLPSLPAAVQPFPTSNPNPAFVDTPSLVNGVTNSNSTTSFSFPQKLAIAAISPDNFLHATSMDHLPLISSMIRSNIRTGSHEDANDAQEILQQEVSSVAVIVQNPQTPISEAPAGRLGQKSSNKGHKRVLKKFKTPFPEALDRPSNQRSHGNIQMTDMPHFESPLGRTQQRHAATSTIAQSNASLSRPFTSNLGVGVDIINRSHCSVFGLDRSLQEVPKPSGRPTVSITREEQNMHAQNVLRASAPVHHNRSVRSSNDDATSQKPILPPQSNTSELTKGNAVQQVDNQLQRRESSHEYQGPLIDPKIQAELTGPPVPRENIQDEVSTHVLRGIQLDEMGSPHITNSQPAGIVEVGNPQGVLIHNYGPSQPPSEAEFPSRPQSRRSNYGNKITRPLAAQDLRPQGVLEVAAPRKTQPTKIKKSGNAPSNPILSEASVTSAGQQRGDLGARPKFFQEYKAFLANGHQLLEIIEGYEQQSKKIEAQKTEIEKLRNSSDSAISQVRALESEKAGLTDKLKRFAELSSKYRKHMNDVVVSQKYLKSQAQEIQKITKDAIENTRYAATNHATLVNIEKAVEKAKSIRVSQEELERATKQNQDLATANQKLQEEINELQKGAKELRDEGQKLRHETDQLKNNNDQLKDNNDLLKNDNKQLQIDCIAATKNLELLQKTLDMRILELAQEKYQVEQLEKTRADPQDLHRVLVKLLEKTPKDVANELMKEDGLLAKIWDLGKTTQSKVNEAVVLGSSFQNHGANTLVTINKVIEDLFSRFETSMKASNNGAAAQQQSYLKLLDDFKAAVNKLSLDKENEIQLKNRIVELGQSNETLVTEKNTRELEAQSLANQLDELKRDLADCRGELSAKSDELTAILATPKEDPRLRAQIQDLETARSTVIGQLESANRELAKVRGELKLVQELARRKDQQVKEWEKKHNDLQSRAKILQEEKNKFVVNKQQELEKACAEEREKIARAAESSRSTMKKKLESEVKHLDEQVKEKDSELATAKEDLQKAQNERDVSVNNTEKLQAEVLQYKEQFKRQVAHLKRLEDLNPGQDASDRLTDDLRNVRTECTELRNHLESIRSENRQNIEAVLRGQQAIENSLRQIDLLENENKELKKTNVTLLQRAEGRYEAHKQDMTLHVEYRNKQGATGGSRNIEFASSEETPQPSKQDDRVLRGHRVETSEGVLRKATRDVRSFVPGSQIGSVAHGSTLRFINEIGTPLSRARGGLQEGSTNFNTPNSATRANDNTSSAPQAHRRSSTRTLKVAERKAGSLVRNAVENSTPELQPAKTGNYTSQSGNGVVAQDLSGITPFAALASSFPTPSPCTDLSSMIDELRSATGQEQPQRGCDKAGGKKESIENTNFTEIKALHTIPKATMLSLREAEGGRDAVNKSQSYGKPISTEEEAQRRRTVQPRKPSLKKTNAIDQTARLPETRPVGTKIEDSANASNKVAFQAQNRRRGSYNRAVSGSKPQTAKDNNPETTNETILRPSMSEHRSPNMAPCKRNKRTASSTTTQTQAALKKIRLTPGNSLAGRLEVADSQDQSTF